jgi:hypothetical protein
MRKMFTLNFKTAAIALVLACGVMPAWAQSGTCISGLVQNANSSIWSEECYLRPSCAVQGNPCQANDVNMLGAYAANPAGGALPIFGPGQTIPISIYGTFYNRTSTNRYSVRTRTEFYVNNNFNTELNQCSFDVMASGTNSYALLAPFNYTYGQQLMFKNTWVAWATSPGQCSSPTAARYDNTCGEYPPAKCSRDLSHGCGGPPQIMIPNFKYTCGSYTPTTRTVCFTNLTTGGDGPFTYKWTFGDGSSTVTSQNACHIFSTITSPDTVKMTVTDSKGVKATSYFVVNLQTLVCPCTAPLTITATASPVSCTSATGGITTAVTGSGPFTYLWSNGAATANVSGLATGTYSVTVRNGGGCSATASATLAASAPIVLSSSVTAVSCNGSSTGAIDVSVSGGSAPFTFAWSNGATTEDVSGLAAGSYTVTVTDANGCSSTKTENLSDPASITATPTVQHVTCFGFTNGSVALTVAGGTQPYSYAWSNGATTGYVTGVRSGSYKVTITDANGCTKVVTSIVAQPGPLTLGSMPAPVSCYNGNNGAIDLTVFGGTPTYTYAWSNGATSQDIAGVITGSYDVTVIDANSCSSTVTVAISQPAPIQLSGIVVASCFGQGGSVDLSVNGGTAPYAYRWSNQATTEDITAIVPGIYMVTVTDRNGCTATDSFEDDGSGCFRSERRMNPDDVTPDETTPDNVQDVQDVSILDMGPANESAIAIDDNTGMEADNLKVYPVPTKEMINVEMKTSATNIEITVYDIQGRIMKGFTYQNSNTSFKTELNLKGIVAPGQYFIQVKADGEEMVKKVTLMP